VGYLWREWLTAVDHKKIGVMYIVLALVMLPRIAVTKADVSITGAAVETVLMSTNTWARISRF
jgi:heme/copper-type cytochrome/quinol oxidase subunit 1